MTLTSRVRLWVLVCVAVAAPVAAQDTSPSPAPPPPAHVSSLDGTVHLDRDGQREPAASGMPLIPGDRLRTDAGRLEVLFTDGSALHLDEYSTVDLLAPDLIRLTDGRASLVAAGSRDPSRAVRYQIDAPAASVLTNWPGHYRVALVQGGVELAVYSGEATLATDLGIETVRAGEIAWAEPNAAPSRPRSFNSARWDTFDRWSAARRDDRIGTASTRYLPTELSAYGGLFDRHGIWRVEPSVGYVWYPAVAADWRPYYDGYWRPYRAWGAVWIGGDPWAYATHHYGRWGFSVHFGWYWIPDRVWGPGWVYWGTTSGYVSWCALGFHGGPVFGHWGLRGALYTSRLDPWRGWTVVPRHAFGGPHHVRRVAIDGRRLDPRERDRFVARRTLPPTEYAVPRGVVADRGPGQAPRRPGGPASGATASRAHADPPAVPRYGRSDGTGVARRPVPDTGDRAEAGRSRRGVPISAAAPPTDVEPASRAGRPAAERRRPAGDFSYAPGATTRERARDERRTSPAYGYAPDHAPRGRDERRAVPAPSRSLYPATPSQVVGSRPTPSQVIRSFPTPSEVVGARPRGSDARPPSRSTAPDRDAGRSRAPAYQSRPDGGGRPPSSSPAPPRAGAREGGTSRGTPPPRYNPGSGSPRGGGSSSGQARRRPPGNP